MTERARDCDWVVYNLTSLVGIRVPIRTMSEGKCDGRLHSQ